MKPQIQLRQRKLDKEVNFPSYIHPLLRRLYASRDVTNAEELKRNLSGILSWKYLSGINKAVNLLYTALQKEIRIIIIGDFDVDGATSTALSILSLQALGFNNLDYLIPNRFENGYGLTSEILESAYANGAKMVITVDNGISSHDGINRAHQLGIQVLVTDHHLPGDTLPTAEAIINPNLYGCNFPSKSLAGVGVVFYLMIALRTFLRDKGWFEKTGIPIPNLAEYLDLVAIGTLSDVVPLDTNNRILIWQGLSRIRAGKCRIGIKALLEIANCNLQSLTESDLGYSLGPRLNAAGRLHDMSIGVALLLCEKYDKARVLAYKLDALNKIRKKIEQNMHEEALMLCETFEYHKNKLPYGIAMYHPHWHQGVIGILASRIKNRFHRPVIIFASAGKKTLKGSGRSIKGFHMRDTLKKLDALYPNLILNFGGHEMAVGLLLEEKRFEEFRFRFSEVVKKWLDHSLLQEVIISDGPLNPSEITIEVAKMLRDAGPWGEMFPEPIFNGRFILLQQKIIRRNHMKVIVEPTTGGFPIEGIVFNVDITCWPNQRVHEVEIVYKLNINEFQGKYSLQIIINNIWPA